MFRKKKDSLEWLQFDLLSNHPNITHGVFLRHGGVSQGSFSSLNAAREIGDDPDHVKENRKRIASALNVELLVSAWHIHSTNIQQVNDPKQRFLDCDGLMTDQKNCGLVALHADCQATIFYDPIHNAIANIHVGWRGQAQDFYCKAISEMAKTYGSKPQDLLVCISPSLGPQNSEFIHYQKELPEPFWQFQIRPTYFDLWAIAQHQLESCGILPHHIEIAKIDTYAHPTDFFSYRREKAAGRTAPITGNHATVVALVK